MNLEAVQAANKAALLAYWPHAPGPLQPGATRAEDKDNIQACRNAVEQARSIWERTYRSMTSETAEDPETPSKRNTSSGDDNTAGFT